VHISRQQTDERLLSVLRDERGADESQTDIETAVRRYFSSECSGAQESAKHIREKIGELTNEIANLTAFLAKIGISDAIMETLSKKENEREALKRTLAQTQVDADQFADIARRVREKTSELREALSGEATAEARQIIAKLMGPIGIEAKEGAYFATYDVVSERLLASAAGNVSLGVVAGVGFEPTTFGL
jgi:site-specific DNA recombinase